MSYCDLDDLIAALNEQTIIDLSNNDPSPSVNQDNIDEAIGKAEREINGYLRGRYILPLDTIPEDVKDIAVDIALYYLYKRVPDEITEEIVNSYKLRIARLKDIKDGNFLLDIPVEGPSNSETGGAGIRVNKSTRDKVYTKACLNMF